MIFRDGRVEGFDEGGEREGIEGRKLLIFQLEPRVGGTSFQNGLQIEEAGLSYLFM